MKKKLMTLQQHRLLKEATTDSLFRKAETRTKRNDRPKPGGAGREVPPERESRKRRDCTERQHRGVPHLAL